MAELRSLGLDPASVLDFSANISSLGPPPRVHDALRAVDLSRYPDPDCAVLRDALSERLGISLSRVLVGNGSTELIHLVARACLDQRRSGLVFDLPPMVVPDAMLVRQGLEAGHRQG